MQRSKLAERHVAEFASIPLVAECVFLNPAFLDGNVEREVCDLLIVLRDQALVVQMKSQDKQHTSDKLVRWVQKETKKAARQIKGAIKTIRERPIWCLHKRRGRVRFQSSQLKVLHALAIVETQESVAIPNGLPDCCGDIPISYVSLSDFLHLMRELRAFPEIALYLTQRAKFAENGQIPLGGELPIYARYLANEGGFGDCNSYAQVVQSLAGISVAELLEEKRKADRPASEVEHFVDSLAARLTDWDKGLPPELAEGFDSAEARIKYLRIQEEFCDLHLCDRRALGHQLLEVRSMLNTDQATDMTYATMRSDNKPGMLYMVGATRGVSRIEVLKRAGHLLTGGLAFYEKPNGAIVVDRDGEGFEFIHACPRVPAIARTFHLW